MWPAWWRRRSLPDLRKVSIKEKFAAFHDHWSPKIVGELNGQYVKLVKFRGEFVWHHHDLEDEMFLVVRGTFRMDYRDASGAESQMQLNEGEFVVVPRGTEHRPFAEQEVEVMLFEPASTLNTGNVRNDLTLETLEVLSG
jgi:mannose-6-phosphate isomerase-like protein (cupin superfamily)